MLLITNISFGQVWENVGNGLNDHVYDLIKFDNKLYAGGPVGVKSWDGITWTSLPTPFGVAYPLSMSVFNDSLYVGGDYPWVGSVSHVYKYNDSIWSQVGGDFNAPNWSSTKILLSFQDKLISGGKFTSVEGSPALNVAFWNDTNWVNMGNGLNDVVSSLAEHNNELFASGLFTSSGTDSLVQHIAKWDGVNWIQIDPSHSFLSAGRMISYNGSLIINTWDTIAGLPMKGITKWDGNSFTPMGNDFIKGISNFFVFNNELYLSGSIHNLNPFDSDDVVLKWNGFFWEQIGSEFGDNAHCLEDFDNELYCAGRFTASYNHISKLNLSVSISELEENHEIKIYPNPTSNHVSIETKYTGIITISDQFGKVQISQQILNDLTNIDISTLISGMYFLTFNGEEEQTTIKLIVRN
jgi:hypothetical protein